MESNSVPGRIQCSEESALSLREHCKDLSVRARGRVDIKGKGEMLTYWIMRDVSSRSLETTETEFSDVPEAHSARDDRDRAHDSDKASVNSLPQTRKVLLAPLYEYIQSVEESTNNTGTERSDEEPSHFAEIRFAI